MTAVRILWVAFALLWSVVLALAFAKVPKAQAAEPLLLVGVTALYLWLTLREGLSQLDGAAAGLKRRLALLLLMSALIGALIFVSVDHEWWWIFQHAIIAAGLVLPVGPAIAVISVLLLTGIGTSWVLQWQFDAMLLIQVPFGASAIAIRQLALTVRELHRARAELARLAVAEERLRIGRDLHDLLGHSLSVIVLKSELAGKLIDRDPRQAAAELADVERTARESLAKVRQTVTTWRTPTLDAELSAAKDLLGAAGIAASVGAPDVPLPQPLDGLLALAVREGVTNVVRHSRAARCEIRVERNGGLAHVTVTDDGTTAAAAAHGNGLQGLAERAAARGGQLRAGPLPGGGYRLEVEAPLS